jgi:hypothetical protein
MRLIIVQALELYFSVMNCSEEIRAEMAAIMVGSKQ